MTQWYQKSRIEGQGISGPELLQAEKAAMYDYQGNKAKFLILDDGRAAWLVSGRPKIPTADRCRTCTLKNCEKRCRMAGGDAHGIKCREWKILLVYDESHPNISYGSSVKGIPLSPTFDEFQEIVNRTPGIKNKYIPHRLHINGEWYFCSADTSNVSANVNSATGITSAATSLRFIFRWITIAEAGLLDPNGIWEDFQMHGKI